MGEARGRTRAHVARRASASSDARSAVGRLLELEIGAVANGGSCVARHEDLVVFVRHTLPGELVRARVTEGRDGDRFWRAGAVEGLRASAGRGAGPWPGGGAGGWGGDRLGGGDAVGVRGGWADGGRARCGGGGRGGWGGCDWQHAPRGAQRGLKAEVLAEQLRGGGGLDLAPPVEAAAGAADGSGW